MAELKQVERIIRILQRLALSREVTVNGLYEYFERAVPKRTIQRDLVELSAADIPLLTRQGQGRELVWYLESGFLRFVPETIGSQELLASYFLERLATVTKGTKLERDIGSLLKKSKQLVSPRVFHSLEDMDLTEGPFGATFIGYVDYSVHSDKIEKLINATTTCQRCHLIYKATWRETPSEFEADPYIILYHRGALYAVVYVQAHKNYIFLPVQRINEVRVTGVTFKRNKDFSLEKLRAGRFGIFGREDLTPQTVKIKFCKEMADIVSERVWHSTQKITPHDDGSITLSMEVVVSDELRSWVGSWLNYVTVVHPADLLTKRDRIGR